MLFSQPFLLRTNPDGTRDVSWRVWLLIWLLPVAFAAAGALMLIYEGYRHATSETTEAEVVRVYEWQGDTFLDRGRALYGPVWRYTWSDGEPTEATAGMSHPDWNLPIGTKRTIRYFPAYKGNVILPGWHNWLPGLVVGAISLVFLPLSIVLHRRVRRWQRAAP